MDILYYIEKECLNCTKLFPARIAEVNRGNGKFCSMPCFRQFKPKKSKLKPNIICSWCKNFFHKKASAFKSKTGIYFCSRKCRAHAQKIDGIEEIHLFHYGKENEIWARELIFYQKSNAKLRGLEFSLTLEEFINLCSSSCYYCNCIPKTKMKRSCNFYRNGIDRINNDIGYTLNNCVTCCVTCNYMKRNMSYNDFINHIHLISKIHKSSNSTIDVSLPLADGSGTVY